VEGCCQILEEKPVVEEELALLVSVLLPDAKVDAKESLSELESLVNAAGARVVARCVQNRKAIHPVYYIGAGKAEELAERAKVAGATLIVFDNDLSPAQTRDLEKVTEFRIIDRSVLILDIFATRAKTAEARLQVDLAQMQYTYPRLTRMWDHLDTVTGTSGALGTRGTGEKQLEIDRRLVQKRVAFLKSKINAIDKRKSRQVESRNYYTVSLVGYTNAGKSTMMNCLTDAQTFAKDQLFATLDTKTTKWQLNKNLSVLLSDTVGFVRDLPHHLVASFRATLEEAIHADLLLHVVDISHPYAEIQLEAAQKVLSEIGCDEKDIIMVFNKMDRPGVTRKLETLAALYPDSVAVSAHSGLGVQALAEMVEKKLTGKLLQLQITYPNANGKIPSFIRANGTVISEDYNETDVVLVATLGANQLSELKKLKPDSIETLSGDIL